MHLLKSNFGRGTFYKELPFSQKNCPPQGTHPCNPEIRPRPQNQKSALPQLFGSTTAFQNAMTQPGSTNNQGPAPLQGKGQCAGQGLPGGGDWAGVLPTQKLLQTNLASPENFVQIRSPVQKLFMIFGITDTQMYGRTDTQTPYKTKHPFTLYGCGHKFFLPFFLPLCEDYPH